MIIVKLQGGLGNQMFEYAFGRAVQIKTNDMLLLDTSDFAHDKLRNYSLEHFQLADEVTTTDSSGKYNLKYDQRTNLLLKLGSRIWPELQYSILSKFGIYIWNFAKYKNVEISKCENIYLNGYWQGYDYFSNIMDVIQNDFQIIDPPQKVNVEMLASIQESNSVCVHIRRGDFLLKSNNLYVCSNEYYRLGMEHLESKEKDLVYYIFSDDIGDVKKNFDFGNRMVVYVEQRNPDYEELRLMYYCKHFIIANSTFSWWAAVLAKNVEKKVVAPKVWYIDHRDISHLMLEDWVVLDNEVLEGV